MKALQKPEIEHLKKFHLLDLMSARHLNYLREKAIVVSYVEGDILFSPPRSKSMGYYLLDGAVHIHSSECGKRIVEAGEQASYCSLEEKLPVDAVCTATKKCQVLQLSRTLVEQYFSWRSTGEYRVVDINTINKKVSSIEKEWMEPFLNSHLAKNVSRDGVKKFFSEFEDFRVREGDIIIHKGEISDHFYIVKNGRARIVLPDDKEKKISVGSYFGDESLVPNAPSSVQVEMETQGLVARINRSKFKTHIADSLLQHVNPSQLVYLKKESYIVIDVRFPSEYNISPIENCINIPLQNLKKRIDKILGKRMVFISQESGPRGEFASYLLMTEGIRAYVLDDGISEYMELMG